MICASSLKTTDTAIKETSVENSDVKNRFLVTVDHIQSRAVTNLISGGPCVDLAMTSVATDK